MKKLFLIPLLIVLAGALIFGGCAAPAPAPAPAPAAPAGWPDSLILASGPVGGGFNMLASGLAPIWEEALDMPVTVSPGGLPPNLELFRDGEIDLMLSASPFLLSAWHGTPDFPWRPGKIQNTRIAFCIYSNPWYFIALKKSGLTKVSELKGKRIACSGGAASWDTHLGATLPGEGINYPDDIEVSFGTVDEVGIMVSDGLIAAAEGMMEGLVPQPGILKLMQDRECVLLQWTKSSVMAREGEVIDPPAIILQSLLPDMLDEDFLTYQGGIASMVVQEDTPDDLVYELVKIWYENLDEMVKTNPYWKYPTVYPEMVTMQYGIPYHPGAIKYWKEQGIWED